MAIARFVPSSVWDDQYTGTAAEALYSNIYNPIGTSITNISSTGQAVCLENYVLQEDHTVNFLNFIQNQSHINNYELRIMCEDFHHISLEDSTENTIPNTTIVKSSTTNPTGTIIETFDNNKYLITFNNSLVSSLFGMLFFAPSDTSVLFYGSEIYVEYDDIPLEPYINYMNNSTIHLNEVGTKILKTKGTIVENNITLNNDIYNTIYKDDFYNYYTMSSIPFPKTPTTGDIYAGRTNAETWHQWTGADL